MIEKLYSQTISPKSRKAMRSDISHKITGFQDSVKDRTLSPKMRSLITGRLEEAIDQRKALNTYRKI